MSLQAFLAERASETERLKNGSMLSLVTGESGGDEIEFGNSTAANSLLGDLTAMVAASFGNPLDERSNDGTRSHVDKVAGIAIVHDGIIPLGFASCKFPAKGTFYLHGVAVSPTAKGEGYGKLLVKSLLEKFLAESLICTTQNPVVFHLLNSLFEDVFPNTTSGLPEQVRGVAKSLLNGRGESFDPISGVVSGLYGGCLYPKIPTGTDAPTDAWFKSALRVDEEGRTKNGFVFVAKNLKP